WAASGNYPLGLDGTIRLAIAPSNVQVLYASASNTNGALSTIKTSTNGGTTWTNVATLPTDYLNGQGDYDQTIVVSPTDPNNVFVGGSENGFANGVFTNSILETTNAGTSWTDITVSSDGNSAPHVDQHAFVFDGNGKLL